MRGLSGLVFIEALFLSPFLIHTVGPVDSKTVTMTVITSASPSAEFETIPAFSAYNMPPTALRTHAKGSCSSVPTTPASPS